MRIASFAGVQDAARQIARVAVHTPLIESPALNARLGGRVLIKAETLQKTGAFKFRGAYNRISRLTDEERQHGEDQQDDQRNVPRRDVGDGRNQERLPLDANHLCDSIERAAACAWTRLPGRTGVRLPASTEALHVGSRSLRGPRLGRAATT